ncbi:MAG: AMP-binding protein [Acidobacteriota bacterium]|nr:AMP-binding protein [Acidobacteriota bacterium]MDH3528998.1 AMP-binding protein [Acidobacteriota bacterium]
MSEKNPFENQAIAWTPTPEVIERAQLTRFMKQVGVGTFDELMKYSTKDVEAFTAEVLKFLDIRFDPPYKKLLDTSEGIEWAKWCVGGGLNITEMCLDRWLTGEMKDQPAVIWEDEENDSITLSYAELTIRVQECAAGLRANGLTSGDAIGIHLPMVVETVIALLAINRIGAIAVPVFSGYGVDAISSRLNAVKAKALFTCDGFRRRGRPIHAFKTAKAAVEASLTVERVFVVDVLGEELDLRSIDERFIGYQNMIEAFGKPDPEEDFVEGIYANHPAIILYTSGTTGKPKGIAHVHCGFPIKAAQDMAFGTDVGRGTRISWVTDIGWMMGPWLIYGALINGATMVLYDGSPDYPGPDRMWDFCAKHKVEILGISPTLVRLLATKGDDLPKKHDLSNLRAFASTGEPWNPAPWWWLFEKVGDSRLPIINYSGGTEISGGILMGNPLLPQKPGSFPAPCPGMAADIVDEDGNSVPDGIVGELVIRDTWIGMARGFWEEPERYLKTYWDKFEGVWVHGDFAMKDAGGHWYILGRSDDTLKVAGKRVGPAEVESLLVADERVAEAAVIGIPDDIKGTAMVAFCVLAQAGHGQKGRGEEAEKLAVEASETGSADGRTAESSPDDANNTDRLFQDKELPASKQAGADGPSALPVNDLSRLESELKSVVARDMGKPLTPSKIHIVSKLPKTRNAKVMRRVIRSAYLGEDPGDLSALEDPTAVDEIAAAR